MLRAQLRHQRAARKVGAQGPGLRVLAFKNLNFLANQIHALNITGTLARFLHKFENFDNSNILKDKDSKVFMSAKTKRLV